MDLTPLLASLFGSLYGSFLNVVIHRLPREESVVAPRSRCPHCGKPIGWRDNLPVLSWVLLRGRGRCCGKPISARYPLVEAATALLSGGLWLKWGHVPAFAVGSALACGALFAVALIDWDTFLIPDELSLGLALAGLAFSPFNPYFDAGPAGAWWMAPWWSVRGAALGFLMGWGVAAGGEAMFKKEAFGGGDVKLLAGIGAWTGVTGAFDSLMLGSLVGSVYGLALMRARKLGRSDAIAFGPFLAAGAAFNFFKLLPLGWPFN
jgi:leader peptidase (prepilin peptidase)/N-methyltransferase